MDVHGWPKQSIASTYEGTRILWVMLALLWIGKSSGQSCWSSYKAFGRIRRKRCWFSRPSVQLSKKLGWSINIMIYNVSMAKWPDLQLELWRSEPLCVWKKWQETEILSTHLGHAQLHFIKKKNFQNETTRTQLCLDFPDTWNEGDTQWHILMLRQYRDTQQLLAELLGKHFPDLRQSRRCWVGRVPTVRKFQYISWLLLMLAEIEDIWRSKVC